METPTKTDRAYRLVDRPDLVRILDEQFALMGIEYDPTATAEKVRAMMLAEGIDPNDSEFARGIVEMREE